eukprot:2570040-Prymnesium_polylepis.1
MVTAMRGVPGKVLGHPVVQPSPTHAPRPCRPRSAIVGCRAAHYYCSRPPVGPCSPPPTRMAPSESTGPLNSGTSAPSGTGLVQDRGRSRCPDGVHVRS